VERIHRLHVCRADQVLDSLRRMCEKRSRIMSAGGFISQSYKTIEIGVDPVKFPPAYHKLFSVLFKTIYGLAKLFFPQTS